MTKKLWRRFWTLDFWLKLIWIFCLLGAVLNLISLIRDVRGGGILLRLHAGFFILYAGQVVFILVRERMVFILSLLQGVLALLTSADFTFVPVLRLSGGLFYAAHGPLSLEQTDVYKYVFISACFTLEMLKTCLLFVLLPPPKKKAQKAASPTAEL